MLRERAMAGTDDPKGDPPGRDVALIGGPTERGDGMQIVRLREGQVEVGEIRSAQEGKPILGESVRLHARADHPRLFDVEVVARGPLAGKPRDDAAETATTTSSGEKAAKGPAKVATEAYRTGWDAIFGAPRPRRGSLPS
jgi:hypothetical protein